MDDKVDTVTAAEVIRNFGYWQQQALLRPLGVTHHGRARTVLISSDEYDRLVRLAEPEAASDDVRPNGADPLNALLANMAEGFLLTDADIRILDLNQVTADYYGASREQLVGKTIVESLGLQPNQVMDAMLRRVERTGELMVYEASSAAFPGRRVSARSFPYRGHVGTLFFDTTEQEFLRDAASDWGACEAGFDLIDEAGVATVDLDGRVASADESFARLTGLPASAVIGSRLEDLVSTNHKSRFRDALNEMMTGRQPAVLTLSLAGSTGEERLVRLSMAPIRHGSAVAGAMVVLTELDAERAARDVSQMRAV